MRVYRPTEDSHDIQGALRCVASLRGLLETRDTFREVLPVITAEIFARSSLHGRGRERARSDIGSGEHYFRTNGDNDCDEGCGKLQESAVGTNRSVSCQGGTPWCPPAYVVIVRIVSPGSCEEFPGLFPRFPATRRLFPVAVAAS